MLAPDTIPPEWGIPIAAVLWLVYWWQMRRDS